MIDMAQIIKSCAIKSHARRRPNNLVSTGTGNSSTKGAQTNLNEYPRAAQLKKVTALLSIPASPNHKDKLEKINRIGIPAEKPKNSMINARRSKNAVKADFHPEDCVVITFLLS